MMEMVQLGKVCSKITDGSHNPPKGSETGLLMLSSRNITNEGLVLDDVRYITKEEFEIENRRTDVSVGDVLMTIVGTIGRVLVVNDNHPKFTLQRSVGVLKPIKNILFSDYLGYTLKSTGLQRKLSQGAKGVAQQGIYLNDIKSIEIPLPPLSTQKKIAAILDAADVYRQKTKTLIDKYDQLAQSLFLDMFGDPVMNPKAWEIKEFGKHIDVLTDYHANGSYESLNENVKLKNTPDYALMVRTTDLGRNNFEGDVICISESAYHFLNKTKVYGGEIIINKIGSAGKVYLMPKLDRPVSLGMNAFMLKFASTLNHIFVFFLLKSDYGEIQIQKRVKGAVTKTIRKDAVREIPIILPPITLQNQFAERIQLIEAQKQQAQDSLQKAEDLFNSLLQRAFKGELVS